MLKWTEKGFGCSCKESCIFIKVLSFISQCLSLSMEGDRSWERERWEAQSPAPWPKDTAEPRKDCCSTLGAEGTQTHLCLLLPHPPHGPSSSSLPGGGTDIAPVCEDLCWELYLFLFTAPQLRPDVCSLLSANRQTEASGFWLSAIRLLLTLAVVFFPRQ